MTDKLPSDVAERLIRDIEARTLGYTADEVIEARKVLAERVRLTLYGAVGTLAASGSALATSALAIEPRYLTTGLLLLTAAAFLSWIAHAHLETLSYEALIEKMAKCRFQMALAFPEDWKTEPSEVQLATDALLKTSKDIRTLTNLSAICILCGATALVMALADSLADRAAAERPVVPVAASL